MSKVAITGDASGTGVFTVASPNSNTDRTLTLPDESGTVLTDRVIAVAASAPDDSFVVDSSGNVGIGTSSPASELHVLGTTDSKLILQNATNSSFVANLSGSMYVQSADIIGFNTGGTTERARIDSSGNLLVGTTSYSTSGPYKLNIYSTSAVHIATETNSTSSFTHSRFINPNGIVGAISTSGSSTTYSTSSDYRLKEDWQPMTGASERVQALKPVNFAWKVDGSRVDGFLAHEAQEVVPEAVTGTKDALDAEGKPEYQGIDQSKLVPLLTAALQEALTKIDALTARIEALETPNV